MTTHTRVEIHQKKDPKAFYIPKEKKRKKLV